MNTQGLSVIKTDLAVFWRVIEGYDRWGCSFDVVRTSVAGFTVVSYSVLDAAPVRGEYQQFFKVYNHYHYARSMINTVLFH